MNTLTTQDVTAAALLQIQSEAVDTHYMTAENYQTCLKELLLSAALQGKGGLRLDLKGGVHYRYPEKDNAIELRDGEKTVIDVYGHPIILSGLAVLLFDSLESQALNPSVGRGADDTDHGLEFWRYIVVRWQEKSPDPYRANQYIFSLVGSF